MVLGEKSFELPLAAEAPCPPSGKHRGAEAEVGGGAGSAAAGRGPGRSEGARPGARGLGQERSTGGLTGRGGDGRGGYERGGPQAGHGEQGLQRRANSPHLQGGHGAGEEVLAVLQLLEVGGPRLCQRRRLALRRHLPLRPGPRAHVTAHRPAGT